MSRRQIIDRKSTRLNSSHLVISYAVFCLKQQYELLGVPECEHDGTVRDPAALVQRRERPRCFIHRRRAAARIHAAEGPCVVMGAEHYPALGISSTEPADHVVDGAPSG